MLLLLGAGFNCCMADSLFQFLIVVFFEGNLELWNKDFELTSPAQNRNNAVDATQTMTQVRCFA